MVNPYNNTYVKNAWVELRGPNTRMLKVSFGRLTPNLKQTELQRLKNTTEERKAEDKMRK